MYCLRACMCELFSLEMLQAGAVKGLIGLPFLLLCKQTYKQTHRQTDRHTHTYTHARTHAHTHTHSHAHTHTRTHARTHAHTHARTHAQIHHRYVYVFCNGLLSLSVCICVCQIMDYLYLNKQTLSNAIRKIYEGQIITCLSLHTCIVIEITFLDGRTSVSWLIQQHIFRSGGTIRLTMSISTSACYSLVLAR